MLGSALQSLYSLSPETFLFILFLAILFFLFLTSKIFRRGHIHHSKIRTWGNPTNPYTTTVKRGWKSYN